MIYKINLFLREWEGYEKIYNFFKEKSSIISFIKLVLYIMIFLFIFFDDNIQLSLLRVIFFIPLCIAEFFCGCIRYEQKEKSSARLSHILAFLDFIGAIVFLVFGVIFPKN